MRNSPTGFMIYLYLSLGVQTDSWCWVLSLLMKHWPAGHLNRCLRQVEGSGQLAAAGSGHVALLHVLLLQAGQLLTRERCSVTATFE